MNRLLGTIVGLLILHSVSAQASGLETISRLSCSDVSQSAIARQSWSANGAPYGVPMAEWHQEEFSQFRSRIADCAKQSGTDARGLIAYVQRLEDMARVQNRPASAGVDEAHRRSQALNDRIDQAQKDQQRASSHQKDVERGLRDKVEAFTSSSDLESFCDDTWKSQLALNTRIDAAAACKSKLQRLVYSDQAALEARQAEASASQLPDLVRKLKEMPANDETRRQLQNLLSDNHYRLPGLTFQDQNSYYNAIGARLGEVGGGLTDAACAGVVSKLSVPEEIRDAVVVDGLAGVSMTYFLCGPALTTKNVSVALGRGDTVEIRVESFVLTFARRRYLPDRKIEVSVDSPIQGGVNALVLTGAANGTKQLAIGNPNFFVVNFYSQFSPQVDAFMAQSSHSDATTKPPGRSEPADSYAQVNCHMEECTWAALSRKTVVREVPNGRLVQATMRECTVSYRGEEYPKRYTCRPSEVSLHEYAAFCSSKFPSFAYKESDKWQRTKLSISSDGQFGYNTWSINQYLRICHDYVGGEEDLDAIGAKFGYRSRIADLGDDVQDTVDEISRLAE